MCCKGWGNLFGVPLGLLLGATEIKQVIKYGI